MTRTEYLWHQEMLRRIDANGNDGADIYDYQCLCEVLEEKYGKPIKVLVEEFEREL